MSRCSICGRVGGHDRLTHRNQILADWWPLYTIKGGGKASHTIRRANRAEDVPREFVIEAERVVELTLGADVGPGVM